ncbi:steroid 5-alpha reductase family enzyme [Acholeplasma morum]|uniref:DUF1295 domain-containing protein n=1 Tax=Paracholeplasma morum TaxID=264637 RepID=UPI00195D9D45|nr:DUF1295 domain-containing protein [Paracholeplasma morum]MBM7453702.1 steroid 5-alpha reductase family enzyme [Paracholeplasma morum]
MNKRRDFILITLIYAISISIGLISGDFFDVNLLSKILIIDIITTLVIYLCSLIVKNASLYDPYWSVIPPVLIMYAMITQKSYSLLNWVLWISIMVWAIRLTYNWAVNWTSFSHQDWRYDLIRSKTKKLYPLANLFGIQLMPTFVVYLQIYVAVTTISENKPLNIGSILSGLIIISATLIQFISDKQMREFKASNSNKRVIDVGLWKYSRHPNYFGEVMVWWGVYGFYLSVSQKLDYLIMAPIVMTLLFLVISIPMMETKILKTRPEYRTYMKETSKFIPWVKKN